MTDREGPTLTPEEMKARNALRALGVPRAESAFRERLKNDFASGTFEGRRLHPERRAIRAHAARWAALPAAAAIALVALSVLNRGPAVTLLNEPSAGYATVDGARVPAGDVPRLRRLLHPGAVVSLDDRAGLHFVIDRTLVMEVAPGTEMTVPNAPGRWLKRTVRSDVARGEVRVMTGAAFPGDRLRMRTPDAAVVVSGTVISVYADSTGTCVCVDEGTAKVGRRGGALEPVPAGKRMVVPRGGKAFLDKIAPPHQAHLKSFEDRYRTSVERPPEP